MNTEQTAAQVGRRRYHFDRHTPEYRFRFRAITDDMHARCPLAWTDTYGGHWVAAGNREVFELARCPYVSNDRDVHRQRRGYQGITIPSGTQAIPMRGGILVLTHPGSYFGHARHSLGEVVRLQRTRPRLRLHPARLTGHAAGHRK